MLNKKKSEQLRHEKILTSGRKLQNPLTRQLRLSQWCKSNILNYKVKVKGTDQKNGSDGKGSGFQETFWMISIPLLMASSFAGIRL
jgi:hypothetical protein